MVHKGREARRVVRRDGWFWVKTVGSHHQYRHSTKPGKVTIPGKPGDDLPDKIWHSIMKQAGLKERNR